MKNNTKNFFETLNIIKFNNNLYEINQKLKNRDLNLIKNDNESSLLHGAVKNNDFKTAEKIIYLGINTDIKNKDNDSALYIAIKNINGDLFYLLINNKCDIDFQNSVLLINDLKCKLNVIYWQNISRAEASNVIKNVEILNKVEKLLIKINKKNKSNTLELGIDVSKNIDKINCEHLQNPQASTSKFKTITPKM